MTLSAYLKAAAKTVAAALVGYLASKGIEVDSGALEVVLTGLFMGLGSIALNLILSFANKLPWWSSLSKLLPNYDENYDGKHISNHAS